MDEANMGGDIGGDEREWRGRENVREGQWQENRRGKWGGRKLKGEIGE